MIGNTNPGGTITASYANGSVTGGDSSNLGGLAGSTVDVITSSYATGTVTGGAFLHAGGLVGQSRGNISESYATGPVTSTGSSIIGGLAGYTAHSSVTDSYARGAVTSTAPGVNTGGLIGEVDSGGSVATSYSTGLVTSAGGLNTGGLIGTLYQAAPATNSYWDSQSSGIPSTGIGTTNGNGNGVSNVSPRTTAQLQSGSLPAGFNAGNSVWIAPPGVYPYFGWQGPLVTVSGTAYNNSSILASAGVGVISSGSLLGNLTTNSSGFYSVSEPQNVVSAGVLTFLNSNGTANTFSDGAGSNAFTHMDLHTGTLSVLNASNNALSGINNALATALGSNTGSNFLFSVPSGQLTPTTGTNLSITSSAASLTVDRPLTASGSILVNSSGNLGIAASNSITAGAGQNITLVSGGVFANHTGSSALSVSGGGKWQVYSQTPVNDTTGALSLSFIQYNAGYGVTSPAQSGNGLLYTVAPTITPALSGAVTRTYDGATTATLAAGNLSQSGAINGDTVILAAASGSYASANAGSGIGVTASGLTLSATNGSLPVYGYQLASSSASSNIGTINPATLIYAATPASQTYGSSNTAFSGTVTGFVNGETLANATTGSDAFTSGTTANSNVGTYAINGSGLTANHGNYNFSQASGNASALTINPATLAYSATPASQTYGSSNNAFAGTVTGFVNGQTLASATTGTAAFTSATTANSNVGTYAINGSGLTSNTSNYSFTQASGNASALTINPATLAYAATPASQTYGSSNNAFSGTVTGFVNGETLASATTGTAAFTSTTTANSNVGTYAINGSGLTSNHGNYNFTQTSGNGSALTINPATLAYTATPASQTYGSSNDTFSGTVTGFVNGQTLANATTGTAAFTSATTANSNVGTYAINGSGLAANNGNYNFTQTSGNASALTINPATLAYTATPASQTYGSSNDTFSGTVTGFVNGQTLANATTGTAAFTSATTANSNVGTYAINGSGLAANNGNYNFTQTSGNASALTINPATLAYTATPASQTYGSSNDTFSGTVTGFVNGQTLANATTGTAAFTSATTANSNVGTYAINGSGLAANNGNYTITQAPGNSSALTINPATLAYTATPASQTYGSSNDTFSGTVTGFVNGQTLASATTGTAAFTSATTANSNVGTYAINGSGLAANNGNYNFTQAPGNATALTIAAAIVPPPVVTPTPTLTSLPIAINNITSLDGQAPNFGSSYTGASLNGVNIASLLASLTYQITPALNGPGVYKITATGTAPSGYTLNIAPAFFTVIDSSPVTIPSEAPVLHPELPELLPESPAVPASNLLLPINALGLFQVKIEGASNPFGASFAGFVQHQTPLAESLFFTDADQKPTTYTAGVKP